MDVTIPESFCFDKLPESIALRVTKPLPWLIHPMGLAAKIGLVIDGLSPNSPDLCCCYAIAAAWSGMSVALVCRSESQIPYCIQTMADRAELQICGSNNTRISFRRGEIHMISPQTMVIGERFHLVLRFPDDLSTREQRQAYISRSAEGYTNEV